MTITISGSMKFANKMYEWKQKLEDKGFNVLIPDGADNFITDDGIHLSNSLTNTSNENKNDYIKSHYNYIKKSEGLLVINESKNNIPNYIGGSTFMEMGFAFSLNRDIFLLNPVPNQSYTSEINAMQPIVISNDVQKIVDHFNSLPKVVLASQSPIKVKATSLALREYNLRYQVIGFKTDSGINEQPFSIEETYTGAKNRLADLKVKAKDINAKLFISIESGDSKLLEFHNYFGLSVCIVDNGKKQVMTTLTDIEFPKEMTDLVPSVYPDLGVLVQEKYGAKTKDPYIYITNGKLNREKLIFDVVVNTIALI